MLKFMPGSIHLIWYQKHPKTIPPFDHRICSSSSISLASRSSAAVTRITSTPCLMWEPKVPWSCDSFRKRSWIPSMPGIHVVMHVGTHSHPSKSWWLCMHVCMHACMDGWMDGCIYASMHLCIYASMHLYIYASMHLCIYASMHLCIYASMHLCIYASMHLCIYASMHACMHVCMYVHIDMFKWPESKGFWCVKRWLDHPKSYSLGFHKVSWIHIYMHVYHEYIKHKNVLESSSRSQLGMENWKQMLQDRL